MESIAYTQELQAGSRQKSDASAGCGSRTVTVLSAGFRATQSRPHSSGAGNLRHNGSRSVAGQGLPPMGSVDDQGLAVQGTIGVQFKIEIFNVFSRSPIRSAPAANLNAPSTFGRLKQRLTRATPRRLEAAVRARCSSARSSLSKGRSAGSIESSVGILEGRMKSKLLMSVVLLSSILFISAATFAHHANRRTMGIIPLREPER